MWFSTAEQKQPCSSHMSRSCCDLSFGSLGSVLTRILPDHQPMPRTSPGGMPHLNLLQSTAHIRPLSAFARYDSSSNSMVARAAAHEIGLPHMYACTPLGQVITDRARYMRRVANRMPPFGRGDISGSTPSVPLPPFAVRPGACTSSAITICRTYHIACEVQEESFRVPGIRLRLEYAE